MLSKRTLFQKKRKGNGQKQPMEVVEESIRCSLKFCKIHRKIPVPESVFFKKVADLRLVTLLKRDSGIVTLL